MADRIQIRRDTAANWTSANPVLAQGELGAETDTLKVKIGDGTTAWTSLDYFGAATLSDLGDVTITSIASGELLKWNGTAWVNNTIAEAGLATAAQGALADSALQTSDIGVSVQAWDADLDTWATKTAPTGDAVGTTDTQTLTNKTLTDPRVNLGSDATGDVYYRAADGSLERLPVGTDAQVLTLASGLPSWSDAASGGISFTRHTTTYTASANEGVIADTSGGVWTLTLPATPSAGDVVAVVDGADWGTNNLTVARNGSTIEGDAEDMTMDIGGVSVDFVYDGTTWHIYTQVGASDADVVKTTATQTLTNKTLTDPALIGAPVEDAYNLTGTDIDPANGTMQRKTTTGSETLTGANFTVGQSVTLTLSAATDVTFTGFTWVTADGSAPTILSSNDTFVLWMDQGSNKYVAYIGGTV